MKIRTDDIVEILNLSADQIEDIKSQRCINKLNVNEIIGMRYKAKFFRVLHEKRIFQLIGWNHGGHAADIFEESQLKFISRNNEDFKEKLYQALVFTGFTFIQSEFNKMSDKLKESHDIAKIARMLAEGMKIQSKFALLNIKNADDIIVQTKNPRTGKYVKINRATAEITYKKTTGPYKGIPIADKNKNNHD